MMLVDTYIWFGGTEANHNINTVCALIREGLWIHTVEYLTIILGYRLCNVCYGSFLKLPELGHFL